MSVVLKEMSIPEAMLAWPKAREYLREAVADKADEDIVLRQIEAFVMSGSHSLWEIRSGSDVLAYATSVLYTSDGLIVTAQIHMATTKDMQLFIEQMPQFEAWALKKGVHYIEILGRKGWERVLKRFGFEFNRVSLIKRIAQELH